MHCDCDRFIREYSDYRDGKLTSEQQAEFREHVAECPCCARYDRVLRKGSELLTALPDTLPADDFMPRLQHRLYNVDEGLIGDASHRFAGAAALVGVASVGLLALFWLPFAAIVPVEMQLEPVAVGAPPPADEVPNLFRTGPFVDVRRRAAGVLETGGAIWEPRSHVHQTIVLASDPWVQASASPGR